MSLVRSVSRLAPRKFHYALFQGIRQPIRSAQQTSHLRSQWVNFTPYRSSMLFSTSRIARSEGQVNVELSAKIEQELSMEREMRDPDDFPVHLQEYIENSPFKLHDTLGKEEVTMTRSYGDELIKISFSIDDLNNPDEDPEEMDDENSMMDELDDPTDSPENLSRGSDDKGAIKPTRTRSGSGRIIPEDGISPQENADLEEDMEEDAGDQQEPSFPSHVYITIERPNKGALQVEAVAQDGLMVIENVYFYKDGNLAEPKSRADEEAARDLYTGPPFGNLDGDLQLLFEKYLEERGVNTTLALFIPEYIDYKEQKEYLNWLSGVRSFVE